MNAPKYEVFAVSDYSVRFTSEGRNGKFDMAIILNRLFEGEDFFNLSFGVWNELDGRVDDLIEIRNGDSDRILGTVANATISFLKKYPDAFVYAKGSTQIRTRRYQMGIARYSQEINDQFWVRGLIEMKDKNKSSPQWEDFRMGINYNAFLIFYRQRNQ